MRERVSEADTLSVCSGKCMQQEGLPNIRRVKKAEAAAHSLLTVKLLGEQSSVPEGAENGRRSAK